MMTRICEEEDRQKQFELDVVDGCFNRRREVSERGDLNAGGQVCLKLGQLGLDSLC